MARPVRAGVSMAWGLVLLEITSCAPYRAARLYGRGSAALEHGEWVRAIADLEAAARLAPHASEIQNHLGLAYAAAGRKEDARRAFERAVERDCGNRAAAHNLRAARATAESAP